MKPPAIWAAAKELGPEGQRRGFSLSALVKSHLDLLHPVLGSLAEERHQPVGADPDEPTKMIRGMETGWEGLFSLEKKSSGEFLQHLPVPKGATRELQRHSLKSME